MRAITCGGGKIYTVKMSDIEYIGYFEGKNKTETVKNAYSRIKKLKGKAPDFLFNAELFEFGSRKPASDVVAGGTIHRLTEGYGIAFKENKTPIFSYKNNVAAKDYIGAYPVLVKAGKKETSVPSGIGGSRGRTAIGIGGDEFHIALIPDGNKDITLDELREKMIQAGATNAINLDGGGSTQFYAPFGNFFSSRAVRGFIGVWVRGADIRRVKVRTSLNVRKTPSIFGEKVGKLYNGDVVTVLEEKNGWCRLSIGWVSKTYLKK